MMAAHAQLRKIPVVVMGGTGFVGRRLITTLTTAGYAITVPSRQPQKHNDLAHQSHVRVVQLPPGASAESANVAVEAALIDLLKDHEALINLVGVLNEPRHDGNGFEQAHVLFTERILKAASKVGIKRYLHMSALGADASAGASFYQRSKGKAEDWAHSFGAEQGIEVTSFRPSVIFGPGDSFLNRFAQLAKLTPFVFPLACPRARFAPVYVGDVAENYLQALRGPDRAGQRIDLCGPQEYELRELVEYAARIAGHPRRVVGLPDWVARLQARALEFAPGQPFTRDNYASLQVPNVCSQGCTLQPTRLEDIAPQYLGRQQREI